MGKPTGFRDFSREEPTELPPDERVNHFREFLVQLPSEKLSEQGGRCMDCGVPFCHSACPLGNSIPEWNDLVYRKDWKQAAESLFATNNFPEFTGRLCPAPCEESCVLSINEEAVTIKNIEGAIAERAFFEGWVEARKPSQRSGKKVSVIGSGPAGLACAQQLNRAGHLVTVFERGDRPGGLLRYGIPDFKLERWILDRRMKMLEDEGIVFRTGIEVGGDVDARDVLLGCDALVLALGATVPRDLSVPGREYEGVHFAMEFLAQQNAKNAANNFWRLEDRWWFSNDRADISAQDKHVIVIGGGDSGADCVGVANRQRARSVTQFELRERPPEGRNSDQPWPFWPTLMRTSSSHEEGCVRQWGIQTLEFVGRHHRLCGVRTASVRWGNVEQGNGMEIIPGSERMWPADIVLIATGFLGVERSRLLLDLDIDVDERQRIRTSDDYRTSNAKVFSCGDCRRGQSLVVWAIQEGREVARSVDIALTGRSLLPSKGAGDLLAA